MVNKEITRLHILIEDKFKDAGAAKHPLPKSDKKVSKDLEGAGFELSRKAEALLICWTY